MRHDDGQGSDALGKDAQQGNGQGDAGGLPTAANQTLSARSRRVTRQKPAPRQARMAISFWRWTARLSIRLATLAQAISSSRATSGRNQDQGLGGLRPGVLGPDGGQEAQARPLDGIELFELGAP